MSQQAKSENEKNFLLREEENLDLRAAVFVPSLNHFEQQTLRFVTQMTLQEKLLNFFWQLI